MFQFPGWPPGAYGFSAGYLDITPGGFPHSEIHGSRDMCSSPWLIAACHVLHRSPVPRHPPCAPTVFLFLAESIQAVDGVKLTIARQLDAIFVSFSFENWILRNPSRYAALKVHEGEPSKPDTAAHWPRQRRLLEAGHTIMVLPRKEVIQPHLPVRLPCYDFTPLALHTLGASLQKG